jgi:phosphatidylglycerol---prolipoprotein diacylglyceryl transferase
MLSNAITWDVNPEIFSIGFLTVRYYGLFFALAFVVGYKIMQYVYKKEKMPDAELDRLSIYMIIAVVLGARLGQILFYDRDYYFSNPEEMIKIWKGGLASHGAAVAILIAMFIYSRKRETVNTADGKRLRLVVPSYMWILDRIVLTVPIGGFFVRMGNLMNSEIFGYETTLPWGFRFVRDYEQGPHDMSLPPVGDCQTHDHLLFCPRHPTAIYEGIGYLIIFFILFSIYRKRRESLKPGFIFGLFLVLLFGVRFFVEFFKIVQEKWELAYLEQYGLNQGQMLSIPFIVLGIFIMIRAYRTVPGEKI